MVKTTAENKPQGRRLVGMGQVAFGCAGDQLTAVLGSCVSVALWHPRMKVGALGHVVLPNSQGKSAMPGKFADSAVVHMLERLGEMGVPRSSVVAKIAGGACMFRSSGPLHIGEDNVRAVQESLRKQGLRLLAEHTGGESGRRVIFDCGAGTLCVEVAGKPVATL